MQATPTLWQSLLSDGGARRSTSAASPCWSAARRCRASLPRALRERGASLANLYGPTETTIWSAAMTV